jgi:hypothetical protein
MEVIINQRPDPVSTFDPVSTLCLYVFWHVIVYFDKQKVYIKV